jgi:branched-chain amino acid transport system substrate-binding protein
MHAQGLHATLGLVPLNSPDVTSSIVASGAQTADALDVTLVSPAQCIAVAKALKELGVSDTKPVVSLSTCINPDVVKALGDLPHWTYFDLGESPYLQHPSPQMRAMLDAGVTYGNGQTGAWSAAEFGTALWMAKVFNAVGPSSLTTSALAAEAKTFRGPMFLGDPNIHFGQPPWRNAGTLTGRFYTYEGHGKWVDATGGKYLPSPPPAN